MRNLRFVKSYLPVLLHVYILLLKYPYSATVLLNRIGAWPFSSLPLLGTFALGRVGPIPGF